MRGFVLVPPELTPTSRGQQQRSRDQYRRRRFRDRFCRDLKVEGRARTLNRPARTRIQCRLAICYEEREATGLARSKANIAKSKQITECRVRPGSRCYVGRVQNAWSGWRLQQF